MDPISLAMIAINGVRTLLANPLLGGGGSVKAQEASELLGILGSLLQQGDDALDDLRAFAEEVGAIADANRSPTPTEWEILRQRSQDAADRLAAAKEELLGQEEDDDTPPPTEPPVPTETPTTDTGGAGGGDDDTVAPV